MKSYRNDRNNYDRKRRRRQEMNYSGKLHDLNMYAV